MPMKLRLPILFAAVIVLSAAVYVAVSLALSPGAVPALFSLRGQQRDFTLIPATELPQTQADLLGTVIQKQDNSLMLRPITKTAGQENNPPVELVLTAGTQVFMDTTDERTGTIVNGMLQQTIETLDPSNIAPNDTIVAWGQRRGDRLTAEVVVDERNH